VLQYVFNWKNYHLYEFSIIDEKTNKMVVRLVPSEEDLEYDESAVVKEKNIVVLCHSGARAKRAAKFLAQNGFANIDILRGGMMGYRK